MGKERSRMRKYFCTLIILSLFVTGCIFPKTVVNSIAAFEKIACDGYWWSTLNEYQKLGFVQGYLNAANYYLPLSASAMRYITNGAGESVNWKPFDKSFGYYIERIDGYYKTTKDLKKWIISIMNDLIEPIPK